MGGVSGRDPPPTLVLIPHLGTERCREYLWAPRGTSGPLGWRSGDPPSVSSRRTCRTAARRQLLSRRAVGWRLGSPCRRSRDSHLQKLCLLNSSTLPPARGRAPVTWATSGPRPSLFRRLGPSTDAPVYTHTWRPAGEKGHIGLGAGHILSLNIKRENAARPFRARRARSLCAQGAEPLGTIVQGCGEEG